MDKAWNGKEKRKDKEKIQRSARNPGGGVGGFSAKRGFNKRIKGKTPPMGPGNKACNVKEKRKHKEKIQRRPRTRLRVLGRFAPKGVLHHR